MKTEQRVDAVWFYMGKYSGRAEWDDEAKIWHGNIYGLGRNVATYQAKSLDKLAKEFFVSLADYKEFSDVTTYASYFQIDSTGDLVYKGPRPRDLEQAWLISLGKWYALSKTNEYPNDGGVSTCGLCIMYYGSGCRDCPIAGFSGVMCEENEHYLDYNEDHDPHEYKEIARLEYEWLKMVREKTQT